MSQNKNNVQIYDLPISDIEDHLNSPVNIYYADHHYAMREKFFHIFFMNRWRNDVAVMAMTKFNVNPFHNGRYIVELINMLTTYPITCSEFLKILPMLYGQISYRYNHVSTFVWIVANHDHILSYPMIHALIIILQTTILDFTQLFQLSESYRRVQKAIQCFQNAQLRTLLTHAKIKQQKNQNSLAYFYHHPLFDHHLITHLIECY